MNNVGKYCFSKWVIRIEAYNNVINKVFIADKDFTEESCDEIEKFKLQLSEYFEGKRSEFDVNYDLNCLPFRKKVFYITKNIKYSRMMFAKDFLEKMDLSKGVSAIVYSIYNNPLMFIVPCHRVKCRIRRLTLHKYSSELKKQLLDLEALD